MHSLELWLNFICGNETGSPGRAVSLHLACSGSQSEHRIRRILPARGACQTINIGTTWVLVGLICPRSIRTPLILMRKLKISCMSKNIFWCIKRFGSQIGTRLLIGLIEAVLVFNFCTVDHINFLSVNDYTTIWHEIKRYEMPVFLLILTPRTGVSMKALIVFPVVAFVLSTALALPGSDDFGEALDTGFLLKDTEHYTERWDEALFAEAK